MRRARANQWRAALLMCKLIALYHCSGASEGRIVRQKAVQWRQSSSSSFKAWYGAEGSYQKSFSGTVGLHICCSFWQVVRYTPHLGCCYLWTRTWVQNTENQQQILCWGTFSLLPVWVDGGVRDNLGNCWHAAVCVKTPDLLLQPSMAGMRTKWGIICTRLEGLFCV